MPRLCALFLALLIASPATGGGTFIRSSGSGGGFLTDLALDSDTVGLWLFNGDLTDESVEAADLSVTTGIATYVQARGVRGLLCDDRESTGDSFRSSDIALRITGDMTAHILVQLTHKVGESIRMQLMGWDSGAGDVSAPGDNFLYSMSFDFTTNQWRYFSEGNATNHTVESTVGGPAVQQIVLFSMVRDSDEVTLYADGEIVAGPTALADTPLGGDGTSTFTVCANGETAAPEEYADAIIYSMKVKDVAETDDEVMATAQAVGVAP